MGNFLKSPECCLYSVAGNRLQDLACNGTINANSAHAQTHSIVLSLGVSATLVTVCVAGPHAVKDAHHPSAPSAPHQPSQQCPAASGGFAGRSLLHVRVLSQHLLIGFELLPCDVARMMVANQNIPSLHRLVMPHALPG